MFFVSFLFPYYCISGHMETLNFDVEYVLKRSGLDDYLAVNDFSFPIANQKEEDTNRQRNLTKKYLDELTSQLRQKLLAIYLPDFLMFGYDTKSYS